MHKKRVGNTERGPKSYPLTHHEKLYLEATIRSIY